MDARDIVVFLGPSLPVDEARRALPARYLGPARCGDVLRACRLSPRVIAILDGVFARTAAIWHKEILLALEAGISVFGASSMGALRAAELAPFGMVGIGRIFEAYRDGLYTDDDEVALVHGPVESGYREVSEAMVNIRATVALAASRGVICPDSADRVIRYAKDTFYQVRSLGAAIERAWDGDLYADEPSRFRRFISNGGYVNQKRLDALELLACLRAGGRMPPGVSTEVHRTIFILKLHHDAMCEPFEEPDTGLPIDEQVALAAGALGRSYPLLRRLARLMALVHASADRTDASDPVIGGACSWADFGLGSPAKGRRRYCDRDLDAAARARFEARLAHIRAVIDDYWRRHGQREAGRTQRRYMLDMMRLDDAYRRLQPAQPSGSPCAARSGLRETRTARDLETGLYRRIATLWAIIDEHLDRARIEPPVSLQSLSDEFRRKRGLERRGATLAWRRTNDLDRHGYERLVALDARLGLVSAGSHAHALGLRPGTEPTCWLLDAIRLAGLYVRLRRDACARMAAQRSPRHSGGQMAKAKKKAKSAKPAKKAVAVKDLAAKGKSTKRAISAVRRRVI